MSDMSETVKAKSDQLNNVDLIGGPITIKITSAKVVMAEQPCVVNYEGDNGKPWKPGKNQRRILIHAWGVKPENYAGRYVTLYRDPEVTFGPDKTGGIRISHLSNIAGEFTISLNEKRKFRPYTIKPLKLESPTAGTPTNNPPTVDATETAAQQASAREAAKGGIAALQMHWVALGGLIQNRLGGAAFLEELKTIAASAAAPETTPPASGGSEEVPFDV